MLDIHTKAIPGLYTDGTNAGSYYASHNYLAYEGLASGFSWTSSRLTSLVTVKGITENN